MNSRWHSWNNAHAFIIGVFFLIAQDPVHSSFRPSIYFFHERKYPSFYSHFQLLFVSPPQPLNPSLWVWCHSRVLASKCFFDLSGSSACLYTSISERVMIVACLIFIIFSPSFFPGFIPQYLALVLW